MSKVTFEQGPIRPPNEANSLLLRLTRNCPWNRCLFCPVYKSEKFSRRDIEEIKSDIHAISEAVKRTRAVSEELGFNGEINRQTVAMISARYPELLSVAFWQFHGGKTVFMQDADSLLLSVEQLNEIIRLLKEKFPNVERITTYARSRSLLRRSVKELISLKESGLTRIHVGLESGNDQVLEFMKKGVSGMQQAEAGIMVKESGISLSEYVILGLGGETLWREHAIDTAKVLNTINPDFIRFRTLAISPSAPLYDSFQRGEFKPLKEDDVIREESLLIDQLEGITSSLYSDHILNLLEEVCGQFPDHKSKMKGVLDQYLSMPEQQREIFRIGRRTGYFKSLQDMKNDSLMSAVENIYKQIQNKGVSVDQYIEELTRRYI